MWTYTGLAVLFFSVLAIAIEFASKSQAMTPVTVTDMLQDRTYYALTTEDFGRPIVHPLSPEDLRAYRMQNGHLLVCGRTLSEYPDQMTGFSVQFVKQDGRVVPHRTYIDRKADRLCEGGRIPLISFNPLQD